MARLGVVTGLLLLTQAAMAAPKPIDPAKAVRDESKPILWYDARLLPIEGQGWTDTKSDYDRLPTRAEDIVREPVWDLSRHSSGIVVRFVTDAPTIHARWTLTSSNLAMPHMPATGVSGLDLYVRGKDDRWRWLACAKPADKTNSVALVTDISADARAYMLYLPLYNGVTSVEIGIPEDRFIAPAAPRPTLKRKPIVFYGTSITHGACASRPGMTHVAILGRRFERPVINLGFSGNGRMETEVVELIAEIDAAVYVLDCLPNIGAQDVEQRTGPCVAVIREKHPTTPILLVEDRTYANAHLVTARRNHNLAGRKALRKVYEELKAAGDENLYYLEGEHLLGDDDEGTVDSSHPTDLGFMRQANAFAEVLEPILSAK